VYQDVVAVSKGRTKDDRGASTDLPLRIGIEPLPSRIKEAAHKV